MLCYFCQAFSELNNPVSAIDPDYVGALSLMLIPGTPMYEGWRSGKFVLIEPEEMLAELWRSGKFVLIEPEEMLAELRTIIANTDLSGGQFHANHASNYLPIKARLPKDKEMTLKLIDSAISGQISLKPEWMRAL